MPVLTLQTESDQTLRSYADHLPIAQFDVEITQTMPATQDNRRFLETSRMVR